MRRQIYVGSAQCVVEKFVKKLLGKKKGKIHAALERLDRLTKAEGLSAAAETLDKVNTMKRLSFLCLLSLPRLTVIVGVQLQNNVQHWLSPPDPSTNQNMVSRLRHKGTAAWFFESSALTEWKSKGSLLWIHGKRTSFKIPMSGFTAVTC